LNGRLAQGGGAAALFCAAVLFGADAWAQEPPAAPSPSSTVTAPAPALAADLRETVERLRVTVDGPNGPLTGEFTLTHFRPPGDGPFPLAVLNHGRAPAGKRREPSRVRSVGFARYWVRRGFAVMVPTRLGYGESGPGIDPEASRACASSDHARVARVMVQQTSATLSFARAQPWVDGSRIILAGASYGGIATIASAAERWPGVIAAVNFSGGLGGRPDNRPAQPCSADRLTRLAAELGRRAGSLPTLWLYAENDLYWGAEWPRKWAMAFSAGGGRADMRMLPPLGEDGHDLRGKGFAVWRPIVDRFLADHGVPIPTAAGVAPPTDFAPLADVERVPHVKDAGRDGYRGFLSADVPRAFALSPNGSWAWRSGSTAVDDALASCRSHAKSDCRLYAVDDAVVWEDGPRGQ
jgi:dienelactone hydrolase